QVYPNPANNLVTVAHAYNFTATAQLTNAMGQQVAMYNLQQGTTQLDISMLPQGIYQLAMYNGAERLTVKRLIKQ
ncbi:MAG: Secretion system C-terminal sorting domain, partial [Bacteroidota bacterium]